MRTNEAGKALIKRFEGCRLSAYKCPAGLWTVGYGFTTRPDGSPVQAGDKLTQSEADAQFDAILPRYERLTAEYTQGAELDENQFSALVSFVYNVGGAAFFRSTLRRKILRGDFAGVAAEFARWTRAGGRELAGLVARRHEEKLLFQTWND